MFHTSVKHRKGDKLNQDNYVLFEPAPQVFQGLYARYSIIKDQGLQVHSAGGVTLAERKNQTYVRSKELSTGISPPDREVLGLLEVLGQDAPHDFRGADTHTGISIRKGALQHRNCLRHLHKAECLHGANPHRRRFVLCEHF